MEVQRSPYVTYAGVRKPQPVPFSHQHHVSGLGIDCRYCHTSVETSSFAGIPPTKTCMNCHSQIWTNAHCWSRSAPAIAPASLCSGRGSTSFPTSSISITAFTSIKGVGCNTCHGPVDQMPLMYQQASLQMEWCLELPPRPGKKSAATRSGVQHALPAAHEHASGESRWPEVSRTRIDLGACASEEIQRAKREGHYQLQHVSPIGDGDAAKRPKEYGSTAQAVRKKSLGSPEGAKEWTSKTKQISAKTFAPRRRGSSISLPSAPKSTRRKSINRPGVLAQPRRARRQP